MGWWTSVSGEIHSDALRDDSPIDDAIRAYAIAVAERMGRLFRPRPPPVDRHRVIVLLPGVFGSSLVDHARDDLLWIDPVDLLLDDAVSRLVVRTGPSSVIASAPLPTIYAVLTDDLGALGRVLPFPYDWRLTIEDAADRLCTELRQIRGQDPLARVTVVAHSMGALVARRAAQRTGAELRGLVDHAVFVAPPLRGSHAATEALAGAHPWFDAFGARGAEVQRMIATAPALYELMPAPGGDPVHDQAWWPQRLTLDPYALDAAAAFHQRFSGEPTWLDAITDVIATTDRVTISRVRWRGDALEAYETGPGDGTVLAEDTHLSTMRARWVGSGDHTLLPLLAHIREAVLALVASGGTHAGQLRRNDGGDLGVPLRTRLAGHAAMVSPHARALTRLAGF